MRFEFPTAWIPLSDPGWDRLLDAVTRVSTRHPFGHRCQTCREWRRERPELAAIEAQVLARRRAIAPVVPIKGWAVDETGECYCGEQVNAAGIHLGTGDVRCYPDEPRIPDRGAIVESSVA